jgi:hypothetical protein
MFFLLFMAIVVVVVWGDEELCSWVDMKDAAECSVFVFWAISQILVVVKRLQRLLLLWSYGNNCMG